MTSGNDLRVTHTSVAHTERPINAGTDARPASFTPNIPEHCVLVRRCLVTPVRVIVLPPQMETSNALIREHTPPGCVDRLMRVEFVDEIASLDMTLELIKADEALAGKRGKLARVRRALRYGIQVAGRHYQFLMFGESQIK
jgi:RNA-dependent RNA polymerase